MLRQTIRDSKSPVLHMTLALAAAVALVGCSGDEEQETPRTVENVTVDAESIGASAEIDMVRDDVVYRFEFPEKAPIDFGRVTLKLEGGETMPMTDALQEVLSGQYGEHAGPDLTTVNTWFKLASTAENFVELDEHALAEVAQNGYFYEETASAPSPQPQSTSNCTTEVVCVFCIDPPGPQTTICFYEEHVFCWDE